MKIAPGGREGGEGTFLLGLVMSIVGLWLLFDSVRIVGGHHGFFSGMMGRGRGGGGMMGTTTSMGIVLVPLFAGVVALFFDSRKKWAWVLTWFGLFVLVVEIISQFRPHFNVKGSQMILLLVLIAGGCGLMLKGYITGKPNGGEGDGDDPLQKKIAEMKKRQLKEE